MYQQVKDHIAMCHYAILHIQHQLIYLHFHIRLLRIYSHLF